MPPRNGRKTSKPKPSQATQQCSTLLEDEMTRCPHPPTDGSPPERCRVHHKQYRALTQKYKAAQQFVDETFDKSMIPTKSDIDNCEDTTIILKKALLMKKYVNAIRDERMGREIHHNRFFLKVDDGHKFRLKLLGERMAQGVEIRDMLEAKAMGIYMEDHPAKEWVSSFQETPFDPQKGDLADHFRSRQDKLAQWAASNEDDDLISLYVRHEREKLMKIFEQFFNPEAFWKNYCREMKIPLSRARTAEERNIEEKSKVTMHNVWLQYTRRVIFHDPRLFAKSFGKVSLKDFIMDEHFGWVDALEIVMLYGQHLAVGLRWWKDSWAEAIAMKGDSGASARMGNIENRIKILGGWIYNASHQVPASNRVWHDMLATNPMQNDTENRYVRLCCNFDELHTFLSINALISRCTPSFTVDDTRLNTEPYDSRASRKHLSLCGVIVTDAVNNRFPGVQFPSQTPAKKAGHLTWVQMEGRSYMFGALRNEQDDFSTAFLHELKARPDLFSVITRSDTDPPRQVEMFGDPSYQMRMRQFEAPLNRQGIPPSDAAWSVLRSGMNVLYGGDGTLAGDTIPGYLSETFSNRTNSQGRKTKSFFYFKTFPVKYFLVLSSSPYVHVHDLVRQVAWAAFKAQGLVRGEYDGAKYDKASDVLFLKHARERLSFLPEGSYFAANLASAQI